MLTQASLPLRLSPLSEIPKSQKPKTDPNVGNWILFPEVVVMSHICVHSRESS